MPIASKTFVAFNLIAEHMRSSLAKLVESKEKLMYEVDFSVRNSWNGGFTGAMTVDNQTSSSLDSWTVTFDAPFEITNIWDAEIISKQGNRYVIGNARWNREIKPNSQITFGFNGKGASSQPDIVGVDGTSFSSSSVSSSIYTTSNPNLDAELALGETYQGRATFYNAGAGVGNSGYDIPAAGELDGVTAINSVQWNGSEASGAFFEVFGPKQRDGSAEPIVVQVIDKLPERADGLDLSAQAFAQVADPVTGIVNIEYQLVGPRDSFKTSYGYTIGQGLVAESVPGANPWYGAVRINNHRYPVESVKLQTDNGSLIPLQRGADNRFFINRPNNPIYGVQDLVVEDIFGQTVTVNDINITGGNNADVVTGKQFSVV